MENVWKNWMAEKLVFVYGNSDVDVVRKKAIETLGPAQLNK